jgi:hypothetical protein
MLWLGTAGPQFQTGERVQVDLAACGHTQKLVGCIAQKVEGFERDYVFILHDIFPFTVGFIEHAETGSRTVSRRVTRKGDGQHGLFERAAR